MALWAQPEDLVGTVLDDRFRIIRLVGLGGMGAVYEAHHLRLDARVAVKVLDSRYARNETQRKRFLREARSAVKIHNDHVVRIIDSCEHPVFFVMEYLEGKDLAALLRESGKLSWARMRPLLLQIVRALRAAHQVGIIHRDVKPSNVFVVQSAGEPETVKVLDFGIAKVAELSPDTRKLTRTDEVLGTVLYMAPEQALSGVIDARSDVYSLGVLLFEALTGTLPFKGDNSYQILDRHVRAAPPLPRSIEPSILPAVESVILRALAKNPDERFQSMQELAAAIEVIPAGGEEVPGPSQVEATTVMATMLPPPTDRTQLVAALPEVKDETAVFPGPLVVPSPTSPTGPGVHVPTNPSQRMQRSPEWTVAIAAPIVVALGIVVGAALWTPDPVVPPSQPRSQGEVEPPTIRPRDAGQPAMSPADVERPVMPPPEVEPLVIPPPEVERPTTPPPEAVVARADLQPKSVEPESRPEKPTRDRPSSRKPLSDADVEARLRKRVKTCELRQPVRLAFQVMKNGDVLLAKTEPKNACVLAATQLMKYAARHELERKTIVLQP